jgi:hypothetical protein
MNSKQSSYVLGIAEEATRWSKRLRYKYENVIFTAVRTSNLIQDSPNLQKNGHKLLINLREYINFEIFSRLHIFVFIFIISNRIFLFVKFDITLGALTTFLLKA